MSGRYFSQFSIEMFIATFFPYSFFFVPQMGLWWLSRSVVVTLVLAVPVGVALGCSGMWCLMKSQGYKRDRPSDSGKKKATELTGVIYEEPVAVSPVETVFSLSDNQAYGQVK